MKTTLSNTLHLGLVLLTLSITPVFANHGNPWAGPDDEVKSQFHDENQEQSLNTPGEDEMHGQTNRNVSPNAGRSAAGRAGGDAAGSGSGGGHGTESNGSADRGSGGNGRGN